MQNKFILKMYDEGVSLKQISLAFKKPIGEIIEIIYDLKITQKGAKMFVNNIKSDACSAVLQLMDTGYSYREALTKALFIFKEVSKKDLESELNFYI